MPTKGRLEGGVPGVEYVGEEGELAPPSEEVELALESAGRVSLGMDGGGGASIWDEM